MLPVLSLCTLLLSAAPAPAIAVFEIEDARDKKERLPPKKLAELSAARLGPLAAAGRFRILPNDPLRTALRVKKSAVFRPCFDASCQIAIGRLLGAEKALATQIARVEKECTLAATVFDLRTTASEQTASWKGGCAPADLSAGVQQVATELGASTAPALPANLVLDPARHHLGDTEDSSFDPAKPSGEAWEQPVPELPALPNNCRWSLLLARVRDVAHSESAEFKAGSYADVLKVDGKSVAMFNAYVAHERAPVHEVRVPLKGLELKAGQAIEIVAGKAADGPNLDDFEIENIRLAPSCALDAENKPKPVTVLAELRHVGSTTIKEWRRAKPDGPRWSVPVPAVPELPIQCSWALRLTLSDVAPDSHAELKVGGQLVAQLDDYAGPTKGERFIPLRGVNVSTGAVIEMSAGKIKDSKTVDDFEVEKVELVPTCLE